jgi:hypothetical protein
MEKNNNILGKKNGELMKSMENFEKNVYIIMDI